MMLLNALSLSYRYYLIQKAKEASTVGILVGTLGVADYVSMIERLKTVIKSAGKKVCLLSTYMCLVCTYVFVCKD